jgi:hypothetical protein
MVSLHQAYCTTESLYPPMAIAILAQSLTNNGLYLIDDDTHGVAKQILEAVHKKPIVREFCDDYNYIFKFSCKFIDDETLQIFERSLNRLCYEKVSFGNVVECMSESYPYQCDYLIDLYKIYKASGKCLHASSLQAVFERLFEGCLSITTKFFRRLPIINNLTDVDEKPNDLWLTFYGVDDSVQWFAFYPEVGEIIEG